MLSHEDADGWNVLHHAALKGNIRIVKLLLYAGANRELLNKVGDSAYWRESLLVTDSYFYLIQDNETPADIAQKNKRYRIWDFLKVPPALAQLA